MSGLFSDALALGATQHGVISREELHRLGVSNGVLTTWVAGGLLHRIHRGVFAVGRPDLTPQGQRLAAVRALGATAVLSHGSAAAMWELVNASLFPVHVTAPGSGRPQRPGIRIHRTTTLHPDDLATLDGIPITSVARTCLDQAGAPRVTAARLTQALEQSVRTRRFDLLAFTAVLERNPHHRGAAKLRTCLATLTDEPPELRSELERRFIEFVDHSGLPRPQVNVAVTGHLVDAYWPQWKLVAELDSISFHLNRRAFEADRLRDADLQRAGLRILRVTFARLTDAPDALLCDIRDLARLS